MEQKKYFAIIIGDKNDILHDTWSNVKDRVQGVSGAKYKSFKTLDEAKDFINNNDSDVPAKVDSSEVNRDVDAEISKLGDKDAIAFTDGSYKNGIDRYGAGVVIITKDNIDEPIELNPYGTDKEYLTSRNIAGEILAVETAVEWAIKENYANLHIYSDLEGIEKWVSGKNENNIKLTREFVNILNDASKKIKITFSKVSAHTGVKYNEKVDRLAKDALVKE